MLGNSEYIGWNETKNNNRVKSVQVDDKTTSIIVESNNGDFKSLNVKIQNVVANCKSHQPPAGTTEQFNNGGTFDYGSIMNGEFGYSSSGTASFGIGLNKYVAIAVTAPGELKFRKNSWEQPTANFTPAEYTVSISKCPGDFNLAGLDVGRGKCVATGVTPVIRWTTKPTGSQVDLLLRCFLDESEQYYLNIIHSSSAPYSTTSCTDTIECGVLFTESIDSPF